MNSKVEVTAAALAIGDELLSGRTRDKNIGHLAQTLTSVGINLREVRIVADEQSEIVDAVNALRAKYDYLFTSGGIGPTHDDITADAVSKAFEVESDGQPEFIPGQGCGTTNQIVHMARENVPTAMVESIECVILI